jgi:hypothetical protein
MSPTRAEKSHRIDEDMALLALDQLAGVEPIWIDMDPLFLPGLFNALYHRA